MEMTDHAYYSFITLTYNDDFIPCNNSLQPEDVTKFIKRLRKNTGRVLRYFYCGEYGSIGGRPHYHFAMFGINRGEKTIVQDAWSYQGCPMGRVSVDELNDYSARYITSYIMKGANKYVHEKVQDKKFARKVEKHLEGRRPEFQRMSRNPALGANAIRRFAEKTNFRRFKTINFKGSEFYLGKTLQKHADKVTCSYDNGDSYDIYIDELFDDFMEEGKGFRDSVINGTEPRRKQAERRHRIFRKGRVKC